jgi:putative MATE family efflux protein
MAADKNKFTLWHLAWPVFIETFLQFLLGAADTLMVSRISDDAVAVVGLSNQLFQALTVLFTTIASGAGILIAQRLGSGSRNEARTIGIMAVNTSVVIGIVLSAALYIWAWDIAKLLQIPDRLLPMAQIYVSIVGGSMVLTALMTALSTVVRNTGNTKAPMYTAFMMNIIHVVLNYAFIYGALGFPQWGLTGVSISTVLSRLIATLLLLFVFLNTFERRVGFRDMVVSFNKKLFKEVLVIGWPLGIHMSCWVLTQLVIFTFLARMGAMELAARTYLNTLESFCFTLGYSVALAVQIQIAHLYGGGHTKKAYSAAYKALWVGMALVTVNSLLLFFFGRSFLGLFTHNQEIINLAVSLLAFNLILQPGKMLNMGLGGALNGVGDTRYLMYTSLFSMWVIATGLSYMLGIHLGWGLVGIYVAMIIDEYVRGLLALRRWRGRKYLRRLEEEQRQAEWQAGKQTAQL